MCVLKIFSVDDFNEELLFREFNGKYLYKTFIDINDELCVVCSYDKDTSKAYKRLKDVIKLYDVEYYIIDVLRYSESYQKYLWVKMKVHYREVLS